LKTSLIDRGAVERLLLLVGAIRSGIIDALAGEAALSAEEVAGAAGADPRACRIVLEALVAEGLAEHVYQTQEGALYRLSALGRAHLVDQGPELERWGLLHEVHKLRGWLDLPEVIRTGRPTPRDPQGQGMRTLVWAMGERDEAVLDEIVERCLGYGGAFRTMLDVGGAVGHVARSFSRRGVQATLLDREDVVPVAHEFLGEDARDIALVAGDYTLALSPGPFDLVYFGNVYHIYGPEVNARATREAFSTLSPGGTVAIQDHVWGRGSRAALFAVNMLQATEQGGVWTEAQYRQWLENAGFDRIEVLDLETTGSQLILGRHPKGL